MRNLEEEIEHLTELDAFRVRSALWRDEGLRALQERSHKEDSREWLAHDDVIENAAHVKATCLRAAKCQPPPELVKQLETMSLDQVLGQPAGGPAQPDEVQHRPVLCAAKGMQALVAAPDSAFTTSVLYFYYCIARELYTSDAPDWRIGGARAAEPGTASAYVTSECARGVLGFARTLDQTGDYLLGLGQISERSYGLRIPNVPAAWSTAETERLHMNFLITLASLSGNLALRIPSPPREMGAPLEEYINALPEVIRKRVRKSREIFQLAYEELATYRTREEESIHQDRELQARFDRSHAGHTVALQAVEAAVHEAAKASSLGDKERDPLLYLQGLGRRFKKVAGDVRKLLHPVQGFIEAILDRELAAAALDRNMDVDVPELVFAAASHGYLRGDWKDDRLQSAAHLFASSLSRRGRYRWGRPYHSHPLVIKYHCTPAEALRAAAVLLGKTEAVTISREVAEKMLQFFEDTRVSLGTEDSPQSAWCPEDFPQPSRGYRRYTAEAVSALDRINQMLDTHINEEVFRHFSVRHGADLEGGPRLEDLFFPDYGLQLAPSLPKKSPVRPKAPVAFLLERMRAHALGVPAPSDSWDNLYSIVMHGPPGTGKTTLIEALARSCSTALVEVTPSDIVVGGGEAIERRARAVFRALSLLTGAIILFDEFDPVIRRRDPDEINPTTVFSFLTPGMLPKLKALNRAASRRRVAYALITNLIGELDPAAVRIGRFDARVGIYPPDLLSRMGRFQCELDRFLANYASEINERKMLDGWEDRVQVVVRKSAGLPMQKLGSPGWFVQPSSPEAIPVGSPFEFVIHGDAEPRWPEQEAELDGVQGRGRAAEQEYQQWAWIQSWDEVVEGADRSLEEALVAPPDQVPKIPKARRGRRRKI